MNIYLVKRTDAETHYDWPVATVVYAKDEDEAKRVSPFGDGYVDDKDWHDGLAVTLVGNGAPASDSTRLILADILEG